jgi:hypothetical protein
MMHNVPCGHNTPARKFQSVKPGQLQKVSQLFRGVLCGEPMEAYFAAPSRKAQSAAYAGLPSPSSGVTPVADMLM